MLDREALIRTMADSVAMFGCMAGVTAAIGLAGAGPRGTDSVSAVTSDASAPGGCGSRDCAALPLSWI